MSNNAPRSPNPIHLPKMSGTGAILVTSFVAGLSGALMPGPLLALTVSTVAEHGFWAGPTLILGHAIAEVAATLALVKGLGNLLQRPAVLGAISLVGGAFLLWMGYGLLTSLGQPQALQAASKDAGSGIWTVFSGVAVSVTNPYWAVWWATVGTTYVAWALQTGKTSGLFMFYAGHELSDVAWYTLVSLAIASGARFVSPAVYKGLLLVCGIAIIGLATYFMISAMRHFSRLGLHRYK